MSFSSMRVIFVVCFGLMSGSLLAQTIIGSAHQDYAGKPAYLFTITDGVSNHRVLSDSITIAADGLLKFKLNSTEIKEVVISIDRINGRFFVQPGANYEVYFPKLPADQAKTMNNTNVVSIVFNKLPEKDINFLISSFNREFDNFFDMYVGEVFEKNFKTTLDQFREHCDSTFKPEKNAFLDAYINFAFANFELNLSSGRKYMSDKYLKTSSFDLNNPEFCTFISSYYGNFICRFETYSKNKPLSTAVQKANVTEFLEQLKNDDALKNLPELREMVALVNLSQEYIKPKATKANLLKMMGELAKNSTYAQNRALATDLITSATKFDKGSPAYPFILEHSSGDPVSLQSFRGKPVVLVFAASWSRESINELRALNDLYPKYSKEINFVIIDVDDKAEDIDFLAQASTTKIPQRLSYTSDRYIREAMNIQFLPQFVLIDPSGNYFRWNAPEPTRGLSAELDALLRGN